MYVTFVNGFLLSLYNLRKSFVDFSTVLKIENCALVSFALSFPIFSFLLSEIYFVKNGILMKMCFYFWLQSIFMHEISQEIFGQWHFLSENYVKSRGSRQNGKAKWIKTKKKSENDHSWHSHSATDVKWENNKQIVV